MLISILKIAQFTLLSITPQFMQISLFGSIRITHLRGDVSNRLRGGQEPGIE